MRKWRKKDPHDKLKLEIAGELGLREKVLEVWVEEPFCQETGKIGGLISKRKKRSGSGPGRWREAQGNP